MSDFDGPTFSEPHYDTYTQIRSALVDLAHNAPTTDVWYAYRLVLRAVTDLHASWHVTPIAAPPGDQSRCDLYETTRAAILTLPGFADHYAAFREAGYTDSPAFTITTETVAPVVTLLDDAWNAESAVYA